MSETPDNMTKVCIDLPNHWWLKGESFWAKPLGNRLYELQNVPFCAYGLNFGDIVRAVAASPDRKPEITQVVERSGNQTVRVSFLIDREKQAPCIDRLQALGAEVERANATFVALNVPPGVDIEALREHLDAQEAQGILHFETCEERVPGSFDDHPDEA